MKKLFLLSLFLFGCSKGEVEENSVASESSVQTTSTSPAIAAQVNSIEVVLMAHPLEPSDRTRLEYKYPQTLAKIDKKQHLSVQDIKNLTRSGIADPVIIYEISATHTIFYLTPEDEDELRYAGVSEKVIDHMRKTGESRY